MKKFRLFMAALLSVSVMASGAALTACGGNDGEGGGNIKPIDEQTWKAACKELDYTNFSGRVSGSAISSEPMDSEFMVSENVVYYKSQKGDEYLNECYSVKNEDGTSVTYLKTYRKIEDDDRPDHNTIEDVEYYIDRYTTFEQAVAAAKAEGFLEIFYEDYYNLFTYNESEQEYVYAGVIETSLTGRAPSEAGGYEYTMIFSCINNKVKFSEGKVVSYSCKMNNVTDIEEGEELSMEIDMSFEFYDIGTTVVTVPQEVIDEAMANFDW